MSIYFIETTTGQYELNATTSISKTLTGKLTDNPVESGASLSDNYVQFPDVFSLEGIITDISSAGLGSVSLEQLSRTAQDLTENLTKIKNEEQTFTFHFGDTIAESRNCMFESLSFSQDKTNGSARGVNSFKVKARIKQVNFAESALQTNEADTAFEDKLQKEGEGSQSTESEEISEIGKHFKTQEIGKDRAGTALTNTPLSPSGE